MEQVEAQDAVWQRKVDAINEEMDVLEVHVDDHERPVVAKMAQEAGFEQMVDDVPKEKSHIDEAVSENMKSERDAAVVEAGVSVLGSPGQCLCVSPLLHLQNSPFSCVVIYDPRLVSRRPF